MEYGVADTEEGDDATAEDNEENHNTLLELTHKKV